MKEVIPSGVREAIYHSLSKRGEGIRSLMGHGILSEGGFGSKKGEVVILVRRPLDFRIDFPTDFGAFERQIASSGGTLTVVWPDRYFRGVGTREQISRVLSIPLTPDEIVPYLLTAIPLDAAEEYKTQSDGKGLYRLTGLRNRVVVRGPVPWEEGGDYLPIEVTVIDLDDSTEFRVRYEDYRSSPVPFPHKIQVDFEGRHFSLILDDLEVNPPLKQELFELAIPEGAERLYD